MAQESGVCVILDPSVVNSPVGPSIINSLAAPEDASSLLPQKKKIFQYRVQTRSIFSSISWALKKTKESEWSSTPEHMILLKGSELGQLLIKNAFHPWLQALNPSQCKLTLIVYQYDTYFRRAENLAQRKKAAQVRGNKDEPRASATSFVTHLEAQKYLCKAQLKFGLNYMTFNSDFDQIGSVVYHYTRAIHESDEKERKRISNDYGFYAPSAKGNVAVNAGGVGCLNLWQNCLTQVSHVIGIDRAKAITNVYPSPLALMRALNEAECPEKLLSGIQVRRGADLLTGGSIKIGLETSRKIAKMFLSLNENDFLHK